MLTYKLRHAFAQTALYLGLCLAASSSFALDDLTKKTLEDLADTKIKSLLSSPEIIHAVIEQNKKSSKYSQEEINRLDVEWIKEYPLAVRPKIDAVLNTTASHYLKKIKLNAPDVFTEIFIMDAKGLTVAASDATSDYWQGDEDKWRKTFLVGAGSMHLSEIELDKSTKKYQAQVSLPLLEPGTQKVIGAITCGVSY